MNYLSVGEAAKRLGVSVDVIRSLVERGDLRAIRTGGGHRRILYDDVERRRTAQRATRTTPLARRSAEPERRPAVQTTRRTRPLERDRESHFEEDPFSLAELEAEADRTAAMQQAATEAKARAAATDAERQRIEGLKKYGRDLAIWLPAEWQARVIEDLEEFVTSKRVPPSLAPWQAQQIVQSRVDAIKKQYNDAEDQRRKQEDDQRKIDWLTTWGKNYAVSETILGWDSSEQDRARREVEGELKQKVKADMSHGHVKDLVDDVLKQWAEDTDDDDEDEDEDQDETGDEDAAEEDEDPEW